MCCKKSYFYRIQDYRNNRQAPNINNTQQQQQVSGMGGSLNSLNSKHRTTSASNELLELSSSTTSIPTNRSEQQQQQQNSSADPFSIFTTKPDAENISKSTQEESNSAEMLADFFGGGSAAPSSTAAPTTTTTDIASISQPVAMQPAPPQQPQLISLLSSTENKDIASLQSQSMPNSVASSPYSSTSSLYLTGGAQQQTLPHTTATNKMVKGHHRKTSSTCSANISFGSMTGATGLFQKKFSKQFFFIINEKYFELNTQYHKGKKFWREKIVVVLSKIRQIKFSPYPPNFVSAKISYPIKVIYVGS